MSRTRSQATASEKSMVVKLIPPTSLPSEVRSIWDEITSSVGPSHFSRGDAGILASYCVALKTLRTIERAVLDNPSDAQTRRNYVAIGTLVTSMAGKLRLVPSTRNPRKDDRGHDAAEKTEAPRGFLGR